MHTIDIKMSREKIPRYGFGPIAAMSRCRSGGATLGIKWMPHQTTTPITSSLNAAL
jgi:hypothetical protein